MTNIKLASLSFSLASILAAAGCNASGDASELTQEDYDDVAAAVGSLVSGSDDMSGEATAMTDSVAAAEGALEADTTVGGIEVVIRAGFRFEYDASCFDAAGVALEACDGSADSAEIAVDWSGNFEGPRYTAEVSRTGSWSLVGLQGDIAELNGEGQFELSSHFDALFVPADRSLVLSYDAEYDAVRIDTAARQVVGGTIRYSVQGQRIVQRADRNREVNLDVQAQVTFQADGTAALVLDGARSYTIDLDSGEVIAQGGTRLSVGAAE